MENQNHHLKRFLQLCDTFKYNVVTDDVIYLRNSKVKIYAKLGNASSRYLGNAHTTVCKTSYNCKYFIMDWMGA
ncbi:hypothetical protein EPI10_015499 [Gossypium australe]|uniref:Uncharacterized protein n=1 Tax=Gossypium australe TaxID=47621 RepID=A0A5B6VK91_9ROSI|nr:hypothetical protein EPI10_015499 [Gossypium australe]